MAAPTHCFILVALVFSIISWLTGIISIAVPEWYVIDSAQGRTRVGAFQFCTPDGSGGETCDAATSKGFTFPQCDRSSGQLNSRFGAVQGLAIAGIVASVVTSAILGWATFKGCKRTKLQKVEDRIRKRNEPGYVPTPRNDPRTRSERQAAGVADEDDDDDEAEMDADSRRRAPILEIAACLCSFLALTVFCAATFHFLNTLQNWLFCDEKPCSYLSGTGVQGCTDNIGWTFALSIISWIAALAVCISLVMRWCFRGPGSAFGSGDESSSSYEGDESYDQSTNNINGFRPQYGNPSAKEMERRERNRDSYRQQDFNEGKNNNNNYNKNSRIERENQQTFSNVQQPAQQIVYPTTTGSGNNNNVAANNAAPPTAYNSSADYYQHEQKQSGGQAHRTTSGGAVRAFSRTQSRNANNNSPSPANTNNANGRVRQAGEPDAILPEGTWEWDANSQLFWSEDQQYFFDHNSGHFYEPDSGQWYNPTTNEWYKL